MRRKILWWLTPILFGVLPISSLYLGNINEMWVTETVVPILYTVLLVIFIGWMSWSAYKDERKTLIATSVIIMGMVFYGELYLLIASWAPRYTQILSIGITSLVMLGMLVSLKQVRVVSLKLVNGLCLMAWVATGSMIVQIIPVEIDRVFTFIKLQPAVKNNQILTLTGAGPRQETLPDFYYLIFDRYAREDVLKQYFDYDNSTFVDNLEESGFFVASQSAANYPHTFLSLSSSLNLTYLDYLNGIINPTSADESTIYKTHVNQNALTQFLKSQGYTYVHLGSSWPPTRKGNKAEYTYNLFENQTDLLDYWYEQTIFNPVWGALTGRQLYVETQQLELRQKNLDFRFNQKISEYTTLPGPKFIFGHLLLPHPPYLVNSECQPLTLSEARRADEVKGYLNQLDCANQIMIRLTEEIRKSKRPAVIVFQSDEGPYAATVGLTDETEDINSSIDAYRIHAPILMAISTPDDRLDKQFYPRITPINMWRVLLNFYFETNLPLLPDKIFVSKSPIRLYDFVEVTQFLD